MATLTWSFDDGYEGWAFSDDSTANATATRSYVAGAIRTTLFYANVGATPRTAEGNHNSQTLYAAVQNGDTIAVDYGPSSDAQNIRVRITAFYTDLTTETTSVLFSSAGTLTLTMTVSKTLDYIEIIYLIGASAAGTRTTYADTLEVRLVTVAAYVGTGQRPMGLDLGLETGNKVYATYWDGDIGGSIMLREYSAALVLQNTYTIANGTATYVDISTRNFYLWPYTPAFFGTASLEDIVYIFGRWDDGAVKHLGKSVDGGASFADIGDSATWGGGWVGAFMADDTNTLYALVNGSSRALYRSLNGGTNWTNLSSLPFDVDPHGVSKHPDGRILISNRIMAAQMVAYADSPYSVWTNATGSPSFPTLGTGSPSVIWIT